ncbi:hypothetical protein HDU91_005744, partial [Kappamyces sp. JEL0680]
MAKTEAGTDSGPMEVVTLTDIIDNSNPRSNWGANPELTLRVDTWHELDLSLDHLFRAVERGNSTLCQFLIQYGKLPWNGLNPDGQSVGEVALAHGFTQLYETLVECGVRAEFVLSMLGQRVVEDGDLVQLEDHQALVPNQEYLDRKLEYSQDGERLLDSDRQGVMMGWEAPLMTLHTEIITKGHQPGLRILNVGFGLGIIDTMIQETSPAIHTIIEAHPDVYSKMVADGWDKKATIIFGRWQDVQDQLQVYDGIFFDT